MLLIFQICSCGIFRINDMFQSWNTKFPLRLPNSWILDPFSSPTTKSLSVWTSIHIHSFIHIHIHSFIYIFMHLNILLHSFIHIHIHAFKHPCIYNMHKYHFYIIALTTLCLISIVSHKSVIPSVSDPKMSREFYFLNSSSSLKLSLSR